MLQFGLRASTSPEYPIHIPSNDLTHSRLECKVVGQVSARRDEALPLPLRKVLTVNLVCMEEVSSTHFEKSGRMDSLTYH